MKKIVSRMLDVTEDFENNSTPDKLIALLNSYKEKYGNDISFLFSTHTKFVGSYEREVASITMYYDEEETDKEVRDRIKLELKQSSLKRIQLEKEKLKESPEYKKYLRLKAKFED